MWPVTSNQLCIILPGLFVIGFVFSMFGRGGGEFILPFLISIVVLPFFDIATISLFLIFSQAVIMLCVYGAKHKLIDWPLAFSLALIVGCSAFFGGFLSIHMKPVYLKGAFAVILLVSAWKIWQGKTVPAKRGRFGVWHRKMPDNGYDMNFLYILIPVAVVAFVAGMLGITGGGLYIPICVILGGVPLRIAIGTNTMLVLTSSVSGLLGHLLRGGFYWKLAFIFAIGSVCGALLGSRIHTDISEKNITRGFVAVLVIAAIWMVVKIYM